MVLMDKKDKRILVELDFDGRATLSQIAKRTRSSKQLVKYRIDEMMRKGLIKRIYAHIDHFRIGYVCIYLFFKLKNVSRRKEEALVQYMTGLKVRREVYVMGGTWDILLKVWVRDMRQLARIIGKIHRRYGSNILEKDYIIVTRFTVFSHAYIHGVEHTPVTYSLHEELCDIKKKDMQLLKYLQEDGRMSNTLLAQKLNLSAETVRRRIRDFQQKGIIKAFRAEIDSSMLEFYHFKLFIRLRMRPLKRIEMFIKYLATLENVLFVSKSIEMSELELNIFACNHKKFYEIVNQIKYTYPDIMENYYWNVAFLNENAKTQGSP